MAGRTGIGIGLGSFITILSITWVGLFVSTVAFMAQRSAAIKKYQDLQQNTNRYISEAEIASDDVKQMQSAAAHDNKSLVRYLIDDQREAMRLATGNEKNTIEGMKKTIESFPGGKNSNLLQVLRDRELELSTTKKNLEDAAKARDQALQDRQNEVERVKSIEDNYKKTMDANAASINTYKGEVDNLGAELESYKKDMEVRVDKIRADAQDELAARNATISDLQKGALLDQSTIKRLQAELKGRTPGTTAEYALADGQIIGLDRAENNVYLDIGSRQKVGVGLTFEVFSEPTAIRPDPNTGDYPDGKASLEVIKVDRDSCIARITREKRGNPVVKGDVVANAVFDPHKQYTMLVYGNFDANHDGIATQQEAAAIRTLIEEWGGKVVDELQGNVDYLVLGQKPTIPPPPPEGSPGALIQEYIRVKRIADQYDQLLQQAQSTSIPVLNENRLYTLIGKHFGI